MLELTIVEMNMGPLNDECDFHRFVDKPSRSPLLSSICAACNACSANPGISVRSKSEERCQNDVKEIRDTNEQMTEELDFSLNDCIGTNR